MSEAAAPLSYANRASNLAKEQAMPLQRAAPPKKAAATAPLTSPTAITSPTSASSVTSPLKSPTKPTPTPAKPAAATPSPAPHLLHLLPLPCWPCEGHQSPQAGLRQRHCRHLWGHPHRSGQHYTGWSAVA